MKKIYFLCAIAIALVQTNVMTAQSGPKGDIKVKEFNAKNALGIVSYDADEVCDEAKVKDEEKRQLVSKAILEYNQDLEQFSFKNTLILSDIDFMVNAKQKEAIETKNVEAMKELREKVNELLAPYRDTLEETNTKLNEKLKEALSDKEFKRWTKYSKKKIEALNPKPPNTTNNSTRPQRGMSGQRGGYNRGQQRY